MISSRLRRRLQRETSLRWPHVEGWIGGGIGQRAAGFLVFWAVLLAPLLACEGTDVANPEVEDASDAVGEVAPEDDVVSNGEVGDGTAWPTGAYVSPEEVFLRMGEQDPDMLLLNVVDEEFYHLGHLEGSLVIAWDVLSGQLGEVDSTRHVVVYCRRGVRSESGYATLVEAGYPAVWIMEGGLEAWLALGYPVVD